jgi:hypothetical protein
MRRNLSDNILELRQMFAQLLNPYRPELHYMRGPGPKWHAKRNGTQTTVAGNTDTVPAIEIAKAPA